MCDSWTVTQPSGPSPESPRSTNSPHPSQPQFTADAEVSLRLFVRNSGIPSHSRSFQYLTYITLCVTLVLPSLFQVLWKVSRSHRPRTKLNRRSTNYVHMSSRYKMGDDRDVVDRFLLSSKSATFGVNYTLLEKSHSDWSPLRPDFSETQSSTTGQRTDETFNRRTCHPLPTLTPLLTASTS